MNSPNADTMHTRNTRDTSRMGRILIFAVCQAIVTSVLTSAVFCLGGEAEPVCSYTAPVTRLSIGEKLCPRNWFATQHSYLGPSPIRALYSGMQICGNGQSSINFMVQAKHFNVWVECYDRVKCDGLSASLSNTGNLNSSKIFVLCKPNFYFKNKETSRW